MTFIISIPFHYFFVFFIIIAFSDILCYTITVESSQPRIGVRPENDGYRTVSHLYLWYNLGAYDFLDMHKGGGDMKKFAIKVLEIIFLAFVFLITFALKAK